MKKRILSILLVLVMAVGLLPATALAAAADNQIKLELVKDITTFTGKEVLRVDFYAKSGTDVPNNHMVYLKVNETYLSLLNGNSGNPASATLLSNFSQSRTAFAKNNYKYYDADEETDVDSEVVFYCLSKDGNTYICWKVTEKGNPPAFENFTRISSIFFGLKDGTTFDALPKDAIAYSDPKVDSPITAASVAAEININGGGGANTLVYLPKDGGANTMTAAPTFVAEEGVTLVEPPKPDYPGTIDAPKVKTNAGGKVELKDAVLTPADSAAKIQYGYSTASDGTGITWQDGTTFDSLTVGSTYYFYAKVVETTEYTEKVSAASGAVTVANKAAPTITTLPTASVTYGDAVDNAHLTGGAASVPDGTASVTGSFQWMSGVTDYGDAGTKTLKAKFVPTETATYATVENIAVNVTVGAKPLSDVAVEDIAAQAYTGSRITPAVNVKGDGGKTLEKDKDYTVDYGANNTTGTGAGSVTVKAKSGGNYSFGDVVKHFDINAGSADDTLKGQLKATHTPYNKAYDGTAHDAFTVTGLPSGWSVEYSASGASASYSSTMPQVKNVADSGKIYVKFSHADYTDFIAEYEVKITQKSISDMLDVTLDHNSFVYDGNDKTVAVTSVKTKVGAVTLTPTSDYTIDSGSTMTAKNVPEGAGYPVVVAGTGNYTGTHTVYWKITKATPDVGDFDLTSLSAPVDYTGNPNGVTAPTLKSGKTDAGTVTVYYEGTSGTTYSKDTNPPTEVGTYNVTFNVADGTNFNAASDLTYGTLTIQAKNVSGLTAVISDQTTVKGEGQFFDPVIKGVKGEDLTGTLTYTYDSETGKTHDEVVTMLATKIADVVVDLTYTFTPNSDNYTGNNTGTFKVTVKDIAFTVDDGSTANASNAINELSADTTYGKTWNDRISLNTITAKVGTDIKDGTFTIVPDSGALTDRPGVSAGNNYTVKFSSNDGAYTGVTVFASSITVTAKPVTVSGITAENKEYDGGTSATVNASTATFAGIVIGDTLTITPTGAFTDANVGENKTVTLTLGSLSGASATNYTLDTANSQSEATADITAKDVTISGITATNRSYEKDNLSVALTNGTVVGAVTGEDVTVDLTNAKGTMADANAGTGKAVTVTGVALGGTAKDNYNLTAQPSGVTVDITQATYGNKTANGSAKYGASGTVDLSGLIVAGGTAIYTSHTDANNVLNGTPAMAADGKTLDFTFKDDATNAAKTADIVVGVTSANYLPYDITVTVTVNNKLTPAVNAPTAIAGLEYNGSEQLLIVAGSTTGGTMQYSLTPGGGYGTELPKAENAGTYTVYYKVIGNDDYADVAENYISVSVAKRTISVKADNKSMTVNGTLPTFTVSYGNFASGDSEANVIETKATASCTADGTSTGSFPITVSGTTTLKSGMDTNYQVGTPESGTLTVNSAYSGGGSYTPSYTVSVDKTENGTITVSPKSASKGDTVTITVKPDKGYELEMLKALDKDGDALKLTEKNGKYTFKMPSGKVTVKGSFVEEAPVQIFKDVPVDAYYYEAVKWAAEKGITGGVGNDLFAPNQPCTRAQIVTFLWRAAGSPAPKSMSSFADVPADAFYAKAVAWAVENGITGGTGDGKFSPDATCSRAQAVTFLYRAAGSPKVSGSAEFGDVATNAYYADAVAWAAKNSITGGIGGGLFGSDNDCTRAQIVTFLYRSVK